MLQILCLGVTTDASCVKGLSLRLETPILGLSLTGRTRKNPFQSSPQSDSLPSFGFCCGKSQFALVWMEEGALTAKHGFCLRSPARRSQGPLCSAVPSKCCPQTFPTYEFVDLRAKKTITEVTRTSVPNPHVPSRRDPQESCHQISVNGKRSPETWHNRKHVHPLLP